MNTIRKAIACTAAAFLWAGCGTSSAAPAASSSPAGKYTPGTYSASAEGYGGDVTVELTVDDSNVTDVKVTGDKETPEVGGAALDQLAEQIRTAGSAEIDGVSGATYTTNAAKEAAQQAFNAAMGIESTPEPSEETSAAPVSASGLQHGLGIVATPRLGPGEDANGTPVYSFNEVIAYVLSDADGKIVDMDVDILEIITPNHDASNDDDNVFPGWPGNSYANDEDGDGTLDEDLAFTDDTFVSTVEGWTTKREKGSAYKLNSGTWTQEMDLFEDFFKGMTIDEIKAWAESSTSDVNGRPLTAESDKEGDADKYAAMTDEQKAQNDLLTGATMSVHDAHGDIIGAIAKAVEASKPVASDAEIAKIGLGIVSTPRLGPGKDDQDVPVYSFNTVVTGALYDADGRIVDLESDILEIITPNHDGADDNRFTGWPGQSYNSDDDADGKVDEVLTQDEDSFTAQIETYRSKRVIGNGYKLNSGTWEQEMDLYESAMIGKTTAEVDDWFSTSFSDVNGRALHGTSDKDEDIKKFDAMTDDQKAVMDSISGATMSLNDAHGDIIGSIDESFTNAKPLN